VVSGKTMCHKAIQVGEAAIIEGKLNKKLALIIN
jgi:hypothetical protein